VTQNYAAIRENDEFDAVVDIILKTGQPFGFDIESGFDGPADKRWPKLATVHQHPRWKFVGVSFAAVTNPDAENVADRIGWARYVPVNHDDKGNIADPLRAARSLWRLLRSGRGVAHNLPFEQHGLARWFREMLWDDEVYGKEVRLSDGYYPALSDSIVEIALTGLYPPAGIAFHIAKGPTGYGLKPITKRVFNHDMTTFEDLWGPEEKKVPRAFNNRDSYKPQVIEYACEDSFWALAHHLKHYPMVKDNIAFQAEIAVIPTLCRMEREGLILDWKTLVEKAEEAREFSVHLNEEIQEELSQRLGRTVAVNLNSPQQLQKILFDELGLPVVNRSKKTNAPSTDAKALAAISKRDKTVKRILEYREMATLLKSFLDRYPKSLNYLDTGRATPNHNQLGAITGRFSVDGVSYQQWPKPYSYALKDKSKTFEFSFRDALLAPPDHRIIGYDFSQVELRMIAGLSGEQSLIDSFLAGEDIHVRTASLMLKKPIEQITKKERAIGKTLNFAIIYGAGAARIANMLTTPEDPITKKDAQAMLDAYLNAFPKVKEWLQRTRYNARATWPHYVYTPFGRKVRIWEYEANVTDMRRYNKDLSVAEAQDKVNGTLSSGDRLATNAPPQGGAADYMKIGMVRAQKAIDEAGLADKVKMVMTIHDALEFYVHNSVSTQTVIDLIGPAVTFGEETFPEILKGYPPIKADWHEGYTWGGVFEIDLDSEGKIEGYSKEKWPEKVPTFEAALAYTPPANPTEKPKEQSVSPQVDKPVEKPRAAAYRLVLDDRVEGPDVDRLLSEIDGLPRADRGFALRLVVKGQVREIPGTLDAQPLVDYLKHIRDDVPHVEFALQKETA